MEKEISNIYKDAQKDISEKWDKFMKSHYPKLKDAQEKLKEAEKLGDKDKIKDAKDVYERTAKNITVNNRRYHNMLDDVTNKLANTNQIALDYINGEMPSVYTINYNAFGDEKIKGYSFSLVNENAIRKLATKDELLVPHKDLDIDKDKRWNAKNVNSQVLQGILQGESIPKIAKRLRHVTDMNERSAIRNARTMTTSAENKGRQDSFKKAKSDGVIMEREWIAAHDGNTRAWHLDLHGVIVGVDEPWENEYGEIMYPGDPSADPANVYNCRCSIRAHVKGFSWNKEEETTEEVEQDTFDMNKFKEHMMEYIGGGIDIDRIFNSEELRYIQDNMKKTNKPLYRVEESRFTADLLDEDELDADNFKFNGTYRSFTSDFNFISDALDEDSDSYAYMENPVVFEIMGSKQSFDVDPYADEYKKYFGSQSEHFVGGKFEIIGEDMKKLNGSFIRIIKIKQKRR